MDVLISRSRNEERLSHWLPPPTKHWRGYPRLYIDHVLQADEGCDFDFLRPESDEALQFKLPR
ncbi:MAG: hypothetical protein U0401_16190 [Anaerolineae bacterium]